VMKDTDEPAIMTVIANISTDSFYLTPDAYYKGSTTVTASLADVKLSCVARRPVEPDIANDFALALTNVMWLMERVRSPGVLRLGVTLPTGSVTPVAFKFRHVLFKVSCHFVLSIVFNVLHRKAGPRTSYYPMVRTNSVLWTTTPIILRRCPIRLPYCELACRQSHRQKGTRIHATYTRGHPTPGIQ